VLELYGGALGAFEGNKKANPPFGFAEPTIWLPGSAAQCVLLDRSGCALMSLANRRSRERRQRRQDGPDRLAERWGTNRAIGLKRSELARQVGVSRARVTQVFGALRPVPVSS
jgi:hypothetical protein